MAKVTFVTACMGRLDYLKQTLGRMAAQNDSKVVVVDYSCPQRSGAWVEANFPQVKVVRETGHERFNRPRALNRGAQAADTPWLCFCDADILFDESFASTCYPGLEPHHYYRPDTLADQGLWGTHLCMRADFERAGGYDEAIQGWGDSDMIFYDALEWAGAKLATFPIALVRHLPHGDEVRTRYYLHKDRGVSLAINRTYRHLKFDAVRLTGKLPTPEERERLYRMVTEKVLASLRDSKECTLTVTLPEGWDMPNRQKLERTLTYRFHPAGTDKRAASRKSEPHPGSGNAQFDAAQTLAEAERLLRAGRFDEMDRLCKSLLETSPNVADAHRLLGLSAFSRDRLPGAEAHVRRALALQPDSAAAHDNLCLYLLRLGRPVEAETAARQALALQPTLAAAAHNLGLALRRQDRWIEAETALREALVLTPLNAALWNDLATILELLRRPLEAVASLERALQLHPDFPLAQANLQRLRGLALPAPQAPDAAAENNRGVELLAQRRHEEAEAAFRQALLLAPRMPEISFNLAQTLHAREQLQEAEEWYRRVLSERPDWAEAHFRLGYLLFCRRRLSEAEVAYRRALELDPMHVEALNSLGANVLNNQGRIEESRAAYRQALALAPNHASCHSNLLLNEQYAPGATLAGLAEIHADWERRHAAPLRSGGKPFPQTRDPRRPLRLGFVSGDFFYHPIGVFLSPVLERLERGQWFTVCYANQRKNDDMTRRLTQAASQWRWVHDLNDDALAEQIRADGIDLLFDLSGHTGGNRLLTFARRPAPVQLTWMGYVGTTGLSAIDYLIADRFHVPPGWERHYREQILRLPDGYLCFEPPAYAPPVGPLPALTAGQVTFGCFNNTAKITPEVIAVWAEILRQVPGSRLILKYHWLDDDGLRRRLTDLFAGEAIAADRLELLGSTSHLRQLEQYNRVDLALDTFPYSGGLTTCEASWMSVPVVTCPGETFASRHSFSYLSNIGMTETIARDRVEYVAKAVGLANDLPRLAELRAGLRQRMARSPACDLDLFARQFANACRQVWQTWCDVSK